MTAELWQKLISRDTIVALHDEGISRYRGKPSTADTGCLDGSAGNAYSAALYTAKHDPPQPLELALPFAGYLLFYLAKNSCFEDGNKRVAWTSTMHVLAQFGLTLSASQDEAESLVLGVVESRIESGSDVVHWLEQHLESIIVH